MHVVGMVGDNESDMAQAFIHLCQGAAKGYASGETADMVYVLLVGSPANPDVVWQHVAGLSSRDYLLISSDDTHVLPALRHNRAQLITYGFNPRACITASSVTENAVQVCVQRAFTGPGGVCYEPQELAARWVAFDDRQSPLPVHTWLAAAAAWAVCGAPAVLHPGCNA